MNGVLAMTGASFRCLGCSFTRLVGHCLCTRYEVVDINDITLHLSHSIEQETSGINWGCPSQSIWTIMWCWG